jgi:hypothetical protein
MYTESADSARMSRVLLISLSLYNASNEIPPFVVRYTAPPAVLRKPSSREKNEMPNTSSFVGVLSCSQVTSVTSGDSVRAWNVNGSSNGRPRRSRTFCTRTLSNVRNGSACEGEKITVSPLRRRAPGTRRPLHWLTTTKFSGFNADAVSTTPPNFTRSEPWRSIMLSLAVSSDSSFGPIPEGSLSHPRAVAATSAVVRTRKRRNR